MWFHFRPHDRKHQRLKTLSEVLWAQNHMKSHFIRLSKGCFSCRWSVSCSWGAYQRPKTKLIPKGVGSFFFGSNFSEKNIPGNSAVFALIHRGAVIFFSFSLIPGSFYMKGCLDDIKHLISTMFTFILLT